MQDKVRSLLLKALGFKEFEYCERILQGYSNFVYKVSVQGFLYKVRIASNNDLIDRVNELNILKLLKDQRVIYYDSITGDSVWEWVPGITITNKEIDTNFLDKVICILENLHTYSDSTNTIKNHEDLEFFCKYSKHFDESDIDLYSQLEAKYRSEARVLCHNDVSLSNLVCDSNSVTLIDYEWGRINNAYWDYGNFIKECDLNDSFILYLAQKAKLRLKKMYEFAFMASFYSIQLSFEFKQQTKSLEQYRARLFKQLEKYKQKIKD